MTAALMHIMAAAAALALGGWLLRLVAWPRVEVCFALGHTDWARMWWRTARWAYVVEMIGVVGFVIAGVAMVAASR